MRRISTPAGGTSTTSGGENTPGTQPGSGTPQTETPTQPKTKTYKKVVISGEVPIENYSQLFSSFINTLKNNNLKIEIKFTAKSNGSNPLTENSATVKSVKESASQLGLDFDVEE